MKNFDNFISILNTIVTIISLFSPLLLKWFKHTHKNRWLYTVLFVIICFSILGSFYLLIDSSDRIERLMWGILFVVCIGVLIWYAHNAIKSLDGEQENILPPKIFWQMLLNKVPSEIPNDGNNNLKDIFAVVSMDKSSEVSNAKEKIKSSYNENEDYSIKYFNGYEKENVGFVFSNLNEKLSDVSIRGVLFLIGPNASKMKGLKDCISAYASSHKVNPIACYWSQNSGYDLPYYKIQFENLDKFIKLLATRGYYRNNLQIQLGHAYRKTFIVQGIFLLMFLAGLIFLTNTTSPYLRPKSLENHIYSFDKNVNIFEGFDIESFRKDKEIVNAFNEFSNYYFSDLEGFKCVKLWYRDSIGRDSMELIFNSNDPTYVRKIDKKYMMYSVAKHRIFLLWPGKASINDYGTHTSIVWDIDGDDDKSKERIHGKINKDGLFWVGKIITDDETQTKISWYSTGNDDTFGIYGYSYDGHLALELDFHTITKNDYKYMSHLMFRNSVRKYMKIVTYILNNPKYKRKEK